MTIENDILELKEIENELLSVGETLEDLSLVRLEFVNDTHWRNDLEATLYIFGAGDPDEECPIFESRVDAVVLIAEHNGVQGISCKKLAALFAEDLILEFKKRSIQFVINEGDETETYIDLATPGDKILLPMIR